MGAGRHCACPLDAPYRAPLTLPGMRFAAGVQGVPYRAPKVSGIRARCGVPRHALVRSECGPVSSWSVPLGPMWVRVRPPHVPKRGSSRTTLPRAVVASPASIERHAMVPPGGRVPSVPTRSTSCRYARTRSGRLEHPSVSLRGRTGAEAVSSLEEVHNLPRWCALAASCACCAYCVWPYRVQCVWRVACVPGRWCDARAVARVQLRAK